MTDRFASFVARGPLANTRIGEMLTAAEAQGTKENATDAERDRAFNTASRLTLATFFLEFARGRYAQILVTERRHPNKDDLETAYRILVSLVQAICPGLLDESEDIREFMRFVEVVRKDCADARAKYEEK